ncbi:unnamed protein product [Candida verbasci]|uniref:Stress response RCI peptide n=1 Tax=Candida verbasci TaxID=1227364 RepID=A0A9W4TX40_9ASCO|nr:unnamed protein product [Candida verbasci]
MCLCLSDLCLIVLSVFFPPLPVWIRRGICTTDSLINVILFILGYFPGLVHSWYIIAKYPPYYSQHDQKVYYIYRNGDLESQTPSNRRSKRDRRRRDRQDECDHHHHHNHSENEPIRQEPISNAQFNYGSVIEGSSSQISGAPPAYTEVDNKVQH